MSDLINRADLIKAINDRSTHLLNEWDTMGVLMVIDEQPTIEERKRGRWISLDDFRGRYNEFGYKCSECGEQSDYEENYCPNCGAEMRKGEEE